MLIYYPQPIQQLFKIKPQTRKSNTMNFIVLAVALAAIAVQAILSHKDGYLIQEQIRKNRYLDQWTAYSFMQHGGMWCDVFIISPLIAYLTHTYSFAYLSWLPLLLLVTCILLTLMALSAYAHSSFRIREAHAHGGQLTAAGLVHGIYASIAMWIICLFYLTRAQPRTSTADVILTSIALTPFFFLGAAKWDRRWFRQLRTDTFAKRQIIFGPILVWTIAIIKIAL